MSSWVQEKIRVVKQEAEAEQAAREWLLHSDKVFRSKAPLLCKELYAAADRIVKEWNELLGRRNHSKHIEFQPFVPNGFLARQIQFPSLRLNAWLDTDDNSLRFTLTRKVDHPTPSTATEGRLRIVLLEDGELHFANGERLLADCDDAAQLLLDELLS